jgi:excisionase family DNA binding protein
MQKHRVTLDGLSEELLTTDELAAQLKVPKSWLYTRTRETGSDSIPRLKVGKYLRFRLGEVMVWLQKQQD